MKVFTHNDYIKVIHTLRLNEVLQLAEENANYCSNKNEDNNKSHDKLVKSVLKNKKEIVKFINQFISNTYNINEKNVIKFTNSYIKAKYKSKETDLVYKLKNEEVFFLIEYQSTIDVRLPYRILNYCIDIMHEWCKEQKFNKNKKYPIIVPIVIYTGDKKWKVPQNFKEKQISVSVFENYKINLQYNLVEVNRLSDKYLLSLNSMFGYSMFIEKARNKSDLIDKLYLIIKSTNNKCYLRELKNIILYALNGALCSIEKKELIQKIDQKVGDEYMSTLIDRLAAENRKVLNEGIEAGIKKKKKEVAIKMLSMNFQEDIILNVSGVTKEELEGIKKEL